MKDIAPLDQNGGSPPRFQAMLLLRVSKSEIASNADSDAPPDHAREDIHEHGEVDEASLEADVSDIAHPGLIPARDFKRLQAIDIRL